MRPGERLTLTCVDIDEDGAGVCRAGDAAATIHVRGALPGEVVTAAVNHVSPHRPQAWGDLLSVETTAPARRTPVCAAFGPCGGCVLQHWDLAAQRTWKEAQVKSALTAYPALAGVVVNACVPSPQTLGYRNNAKLVCARGADGTLVLGAFAPRSHDVVDLAGCRIVEPPLDEVTSGLREALVTAGVVPYDERLQTGDLRYAVLRANHRGQVLVTLVTARPSWAAGAAVAEALRTRCPAVAGVVQNVNPTRGNVIYGDEDVTLSGVATLSEQIGPAHLRVSSRAFLQANRGVAALAYAHVAESVRAVAAAAPIDRLIDAYCGVGAIALTVAPHAREVLGIEANATAIADASAAVSEDTASHTNVRFITADAAAGLRAVDRADAVILNPPRRGCAPAVLAEVRRLAPRLVAYLSCAPDTLARDLATLVDGESGYRVDAVTPYDMLPHTAHVESLAMMSR
jgi:23S rRNA (uracil1939-C5)-methyltransferase